MQQCMKKPSAKYKELIQMRNGEGLSYKDIANPHWQYRVIGTRYGGEGTDNAHHAIQRKEKEMKKEEQ